MQILKIPADWDPIWTQNLLEHKKIGFVPTMGALHMGHLDLVQASLAACDCTVVSIFVNPTQFTSAKDFETYPKTIDQDLGLLRDAGVDAVFTPDTQTVYPQATALNLDFGDLENVLEGKFRPGHFSGVGLVVSKLFHLIRPHVAYFGQKDLQQVAVIKRLVNDLSFPLQINTVPTRRESSGLALSSRNIRLNGEQKGQALILIQSLRKAKTALLAGDAWTAIKLEIERDFNEQPSAELEYFELVDPQTFKMFQEFDPNQKSSLCVAAAIGEVRLIDNLPVID